MLTAGLGVLRVVLIVAIHGDNAQAVRAVFKEITEGVLQRRALAFIDLMMEQGNFRVLGGKIGKVVQVFGLAAVVDQNNIGKAVLEQSIHHGHELFVRVKGGKNHGNSG